LVAVEEFLVETNAYVNDMKNIQKKRSNTNSELLHIDAENEGKKLLVQKNINDY